MNEEIIRRQIHTTDAGLRLREEAPGGAARTIEGYAIRFGEPSAVMGSIDGVPVVEVIDRGAVTRGLLDGSDILMTLYHDRGMILARSRQGKGTLSYDLDEAGVKFRFEAPATVDGDKAVELVRRGDICGCSFAFSTKYRSADHVEVVKDTGEDGKERRVCRVKKMTGIYDFTLTPDPAYPSTSVGLRDAMSAIEEMGRSEESEESEEGEAKAEEPAKRETPGAKARLRRKIMEIRNKQK